MSSNKTMKQNDVKATQKEGGTLSKIISITSKVLAPTTLITALLYYFGWARSRAYYGYFGIHPSMLGHSTQDYLVSSIVAAFEPVRWLLIIGLVGVWFNHWLHYRIERPSERKVAGSIKWLAGIILGLGILFVIAGPIIFLLNWSVPPIVFSSTWLIGIILTSYGLSLWLSIRRQIEKNNKTKSWIANVPNGLKQASLGIISGMILFSLFWFISMYADVIGKWEGAQLETHLTDQPCVELMSKTALGLEGKGYTQVTMNEGENNFKYQYHNLRFLVRSADKYFLLPNQWGVESANTIVVKDDETIQVVLIPSEFCLP